jgi:pantoate--beta-alanine ligase
MESITRIHTVRERVAQWRQQKQRIAFVPTMGNLHRGHISLVAQARERADRVVVSIFVNPLQFGPNEDFGAYPRTIEHDTELLTKASADLLFHPGTFEIYPVGHERTTVVDVPELSGILCGAFRPGHFAGVATVVTKLFNIVQPDVAVFGEKDYQQLVIIQRLAADLCLPIEIVGVPTLRDHDGLALSSRNRYLTPGQRNTAPRLHEALKAAKQRIQSGERDYEAIQKNGHHALELAGFQPDYFAIRQAADLAPIREASRELVILAAARLGKARLIDNVKVTLVEKH